MQPVCIQKLTDPKLALIKEKVLVDVGDFFLHDQGLNVNPAADSEVYTGVLLLVRCGHSLTSFNAVYSVAS